MPMTTPLGSLLSHLRQIAAGAETRDWSDADLVAQFAVARDEMAFAALVRRRTTCVSFSPDGRWMAIGTANGTGTLREEVGKEAGHVSIRTVPDSE